MQTIDPTQPVLVTGATGYVAGWIVKRLLEAGLQVHATVRDPNNTAKIAHLQRLAEQSKGSIRFFRADLLNADDFDAPMRDCQLVFHTASPFINKVDDPQRQLIEPALLGTRNVLQAANRCPSVRRVVLTSSVAAVFGDTRDLQKLPTQMADESHWNYSSSLDHQPYSYSKMLAEREAWNICQAQQRWDMVTINPTLVLGPSLSRDNTSESFRLMKQLGDGTLRMGAPRLDIGLVDVRDVAEAHYQAAFRPTAKGRHIVSGAHHTFKELADMLRAHYGNHYPLPKGYVPNALIWLMAPLLGVKRRMIANNLGFPWLVDNSKSVRELGMQYRPMHQTIVDTFQQLIEWGVFPKR